MDSDYCKACVGYSACGPAAHKTLGELGHIIDVSDLIKLHEKARLKLAKPERVEVAYAGVAGELPALPLQIQRSTTIGRVEFDIDIRTMDAIAKITNGKAQAQALALARSNMIAAINVELPQGKNPFESAPPKYLKVVMDRLLAGGFTKAELKRAFIEQLEHSDSTAASHVSIAIAVLEALQVIRQEGRTITLAARFGNPKQPSLIEN
ncbi:hypothetical protein ACODYM_29505 [Burkholderia gladioli]|uniref:hypothetical protein n=1 Tax=Burkholderia gladioli TaxID=28095 RepID=UPI003B50761C